MHLLTRTTNELGSKKGAGETDMVQPPSVVLPHWPPTTDTSVAMVTWAVPNIRPAPLDDCLKRNIRIRSCRVCEASRSDERVRSYPNLPVLTVTLPLSGLPSTAVTAALDPRNSRTTLPTVWWPDSTSPVWASSLPISHHHHHHHHLQ